MNLAKPDLFSKSEGSVFGKASMLSGQTARNSLLRYRYMPNTARQGVTSEVQCGQREACNEIGEQQYGQSRVVGAAAGASSSRFNLLMALISRNTAKATMTKLITELRKIP